MGSSPIIHPALLGRLANFYPSEVTIQVNTPAQDSYGEPIASWANFAGHILLPCAMAAMPVGREIKRPDGTIAISAQRIAIAGLYEDILPTMRAMVAGQAYDILAVQHDSHTKTTYLTSEVVT